uniref:Uncharacterized protein n=1 Tax=Megaviridae environmental sample TaxID=1737588 RepID=A0A5J6VIM3_9VIRU|nr:MAG: hypothetical protein [Megaviridae environmental sample]
MDHLNKMSDFLTTSDYVAICGATLPNDFPMEVARSNGHVTRTVLKREAIRIYTRGGNVLHGAYFDDNGTIRYKSLEYLYVDDDAKDAIMDLVDVCINGVCPQVEDV